MTLSVVSSFYSGTVQNFHPLGRYIKCECNNCILSLRQTLISSISIAAPVQEDGNDRDPVPVDVTGHCSDNDLPDPQAVEHVGGGPRLHPHC